MTRPVGLTATSYVLEPLLYSHVLGSCRSYAESLKQRMYDQDPNIQRKLVSSIAWPLFALEASCPLSASIPVELQLAESLPAPQGLSEIPYMGVNLHSSQEDLFEVYNRGRLLNPKRPSENQQVHSQPDILGFHAPSTEFGGEIAEPENSLLPQVSKRQKNDQYNYNYGGTNSPYLSFGPPTLSTGANHAMSSVFEDARNFQAGHDFQSWSSFPTSPNYPTSLGSPQPHAMEHGAWNLDNPDSTFRTPMLETVPEVDTSNNLSWLHKQLDSDRPGSEKFDAHGWISFVNQFEVPSAVPELPARKGHTESHDHPQFQRDAHPGQDYIGLHAGPNEIRRHNAVDDYTNNQVLISSQAHYPSENHEQSPRYRRVSPEGSSAQDEFHVEDNAEAYDQLLQDANKKQKKSAHLRLIDSAKETGPSLSIPHLHLPRQSVSIGLLESFTKRFQNELVNNMKFANARGSRESYSIDDSTAKLNRWKNTNDFVVRILLHPQFIETDHKKRPNQRSTKLTTQFKKLIKWIVFINAAILRNLTGDIQHGDEVKLHEKLVEWLFDEVFYPPNSYPVIGIVSNIQRSKLGNKFGELQRIVVNYLSLKPDSNELEVALPIIKIYYETFNPEIWNRVGHTQENVAYRKLMLLIAHALKTDMKVLKGVDDHGYENFKLGNFQICNLEILPRSMMPHYPTLRYDVTLGTEETITMESFRKISLSMGDIDRYPDKIKSGGLGTVILKNTPDLEQDSSGYLWIELETGLIASRIQVSRSLEMLMANLKACHVGFSDFVKLKGMELQTQKSFFLWIHNLLMVGPKEKLPLFGKVELEKIIQDDDDGLIGNSNFSDPQIFLLDYYFSDCTSHFKAIHVALSLIGHWYKENQKETFIKIFKTDKTFWNAMITLLEPKFRFRKKYTLRYFLPDLST
ncbi:uncharacterized protein PGTG_17010 [Puccinia graminis f. sp. tritici CRL 75-36-700-3]|uniref:Uncharacterized protein n=1 Tax=Puccinia graminis f. sp. tritici (strain CRL 75-36-700-3 / race SCCL) TaxID=418459 RepID=E3L481_PUCGT|nr:uncharacterized protein PGTG_17010 [Puccinia graminis f. sp. tritici CRL 75-36-700-3]EFP91356.1 hypothetical protein PGTG_17010 [Puccinia graminis f. sp. tritici CRL 75-36-700-3]